MPSLVSHTWCLLSLTRASVGTWLHGGMQCSGFVGTLACDAVVLSAPRHAVALSPASSCRLPPLVASFRRILKFPFSRDLVGCLLMWHVGWLVMWYVLAFALQPPHVPSLRGLPRVAMMRAVVRSVVEASRSRSLTMSSLCLHHLGSLLFSLSLSLSPSLPPSLSLPAHTHTHTTQAILDWGAQAADRGPESLKLKEECKQLLDYLQQDDDEDDDDEDDDDE
jgi:hypothetical protein